VLMTHGLRLELTGGIRDAGAAERKLFCASSN
jgi:hypothetical protein